MNSTREIGKKPKKKSLDHERFLPRIINIGEFTLMDILDTPPEMIIAITELIKRDSAFDPNLVLIKQTDTIKRRYRVYTLKNGNPIMVNSYMEWLSNPYGFGPGEFNVMRFVFPDFRKKPVVGIIDHLLKYYGYKKGYFKKVYGFYKIDPSVTEETIWQNILNIFNDNICCPSYYLPTQEGIDQIKAFTSFRVVQNGEYKFALFETKLEDIKSFKNYLKQSTLSDHIDRLDQIIEERS